MAMSLSEHQSGQGLVEYALVIIMVAILVIVILVFLGPVVGDLFSNVVSDI
jgi:pilus assembly protein Flp/PilA